MEMKNKMKKKMQSYITVKLAQVWLLVLIIGVVIIWVAPKIVAVMVVLMLLIIGVVISVLLPKTAPIFLMVRDFKKNDWKVDIKAGLSKKEDEYDVIVVGAGMGGLSSAALLTKRGYKVLLLEKNSKVGGCLSSFEKDGFTFTTGQVDINELHESGNLTRFTKELGLNKDEYFVRNSKIRYISNKKQINVPEDFGEFMELHYELFPEEKESLMAFFKEARDCYNSRNAQRTYKDFGTYLPVDLSIKVYGAFAYIPVIKNFLKTSKLFNKVYAQKLSESFKDEGLKKLLCCMIPYMGAKPETARTLLAYYVYMTYNINRGSCPIGGAHRFVDDISSFIKTNGGTILLEHKADKILVENGRAAGVVSGNKIFKSNVVISNANAKTTIFGLVGENNVDKEYVDYIKAIKMSPAMSLVFLGVEMDLSIYPNFIKDLDEGFDIFINSNADKSSAPKGKACITIIEHPKYNYNDFPERNTDKYYKVKREYMETLINKAQKHIPDLSKHIVYKDSSTPKTLEHYTLVPEGAMYIFDTSTENIPRPSFKTPIKGLYLAGASVFVGCGVSNNVVSGRICANDICDWKYKIDVE